MKQRDVAELSTGEAKVLLNRIGEFGTPSPHLVLTGGDPLKRCDFFELLEYGAALGLRMSVAPSATKALTPELFRGFKRFGVESIALSLDGSSEEKHDGLRGVRGCFSSTMQAARLALDAGLAVQINTLVTAETISELPEIYRLLSGLPLMRWKLFTLIAVGRGRLLREITPRQYEAMHHWLHYLSREAPFAVATTEAPHFRRVALTRMRAEGMPWKEIRSTPVGRGFGIRDGNGVMFISHTGDVYPSGFLPLVAGNVREEHVAEIYRQAELFTKIRDTAEFTGRCGRCGFKEICGGSRARAYARYGDYLAEDPACRYQPKKEENHV
jgi:radical SAM protein